MALLRLRTQIKIWINFLGNARSGHDERKHICYPGFSTKGIHGSCKIICLVFKGKGSVQDPDSLSPDPDTAFRLNTDPDTDPRFWRPIIEKNLQLEIFVVDIFWSKIAIYLSPGLQKGRPSYRRNLKGTQAWEFFGLWFWNLYFFVVSYA